MLIEGAVLLAFAGSDVAEVKEAWASDNGEASIATVPPERAYTTLAKKTAM
jgi:hypothetical protein